MLGFGVAFAPRVPAYVLWAAAGVALVLAVLLVAVRSRGGLVRALALALMVLALANPSFTREDDDDAASRPARGGDGVSPIIITSNDLAGAWAIRPDGQAMLPLTPGEPKQREYAFRAGVNIVMYTLTGNYKADQVHAPALIERLGQ